jgi:hypothetical protein
LSNLEVIDADGVRQIVVLRDPLMLPAPSAAKRGMIVPLIQRNNECSCFGVPKNADHQDRYLPATRTSGSSANKPVLWHAGNADEEEVYLSVLKTALRSWFCFSKNQKSCERGLAFN